MQYLTIPNFAHWQHYKDRTPPWIKLHRDLLRDYDFSLLPDKTKAHLMLIWLLASQLDNCIPNDPNYIQRMTGSGEKPDLKILIEKGFLIPDASCQQDASKPLAERKQVAMREEEAETELEEEEEKDPLYPPEYEIFWEMFPKQRIGNKRKAFPAWKGALKRGTAQEILHGLGLYNKSDEVNRGFAKGAAAWLNDDRWKVNYGGGETAFEQLLRETQLAAGGGDYAGFEAAGGRVR